MKLYYDEGPARMTFGAAGTFRLGEPREIDDSLAETLLKKGRLKEFQEAAAAPAAETPKRQGKAAGKKEE
jgi:hypothetical protein